MAKRRSSTSKSQNNALTGMLALVGLAVFLILILLFGFQGALERISEWTGVDVVDETAEPGTDTGGQVDAPTTIPGGGEPVDGAGAYYTIYFTEPETFTGDEIEGGIEQNLIELINNAETSIYGATFEFNLQNVADALIAAHQRGVDVKLVYDDEHTEEDPQMEEMLDAGIPGTPDERSAFMHNKFFVIDGQMVWLGSWNVSLNDTFRNNNNVIVIRSTQLAQNYTQEFNEMFAGNFGPTSPNDTPNAAFTFNGIPIESYFSSEEDPMPKLVEFVESAQQSVHFMAFSFTDDALAAAMVERHFANVEVAGIFESRGANTEHSSCPPLLESGAAVKLDSNPRTFHHKIIIIDSKAVAIGSFNYSNNAANNNDENLIIIHDPAVAAVYEEEFNKLYGQAIEPVGGECLSD